MTLRNPGRLAIHRRSDEVAFLQQRLRVLEAALRDRPDQHDAPAAEHDLQTETLKRERDLADELVHTRQTEPLGETLQRRLAMAERVYRDLMRAGADSQERLPDTYRIAEIERQALAQMLKHWWDWLGGS